MNRDFVREVAAGSKGKERHYWRQKLAGRLTKAHFPHDHVGKSGAQEGEEAAAAVFNSTLSGRLADDLTALCRGSDYMLHMALTAAVVALLHLYTEHRDIMVGAPIYRQQTEGQFLNTLLVLRHRLHPGLTFRQLLRQTRQVIMEAEEHQNFPIDTLFPQLDMAPPNRGEDPSPVDVIILMPAIHEAQYMRHLRPSMVFSFDRAAGEIRAAVTYDPRLYRHSSIDRITAHLRRFLEEALRDVNPPLADIDMVPAEEKARLLVDFNRTDAAYEGDTTIAAVFAARVEQGPDRTAVVGLNRDGTALLQVTYRMLHTLSGQWAARLARQGVRTDTIVGIMMPSSVDLITAIMAVVQSGGAYLPLDAESPAERIDYMLADSCASVVLRESADGLSQSTGNPLPLSPAAPFSLAYVLYTSGTTGRPRGVMIRHRSVVNLVTGLRERVYRQYGSGRSLRVAMAAPAYFDASVKQIFAALLLGHSLHPLPPEMKRDGGAILAFYRTHRLEIADATPSLLMLLLKSGGAGQKSEGLPRLRHLVVGGEPLPMALVCALLNRWPNPGLKITNVYGPSECCVDATAFEVNADNLEGLQDIPIGRPMPHYRLYILDNHGRPRPLGTVGELTIAGPGLARGYLNHPELTADRFVNAAAKSREDTRSFKNNQSLKDPIIPSFQHSIIPVFKRSGSLLYRTGDLGRFRPDGNIEFLGRLDHQVKIRGYRIEPTEIEAWLLKHDAAAAAVVLTREDEEGGKYLCAYIVPQTNRTSQTNLTDELRSYLSLHLPDYMIPPFFVYLDELPLTPNGKVDRRALPPPSIQAQESHTPPRDRREQRLARVWAEVLKVPPTAVGIDDNFFHLGGHSLSATSLVSAIHREFNVRLPLKEVFRAPSIRAMTAYIGTAAEEQFLSIKPVEKKDYYRLSSAQKRLYILHRLTPDSIAYNTPMAVTLEGSLERQRLEEVFGKLLRRHDSFRTYFGMAGSEPVQRIREPGDMTLAIDYDRLPPGESETQRINDFIRPFDLTAAPLLRVGVIDLGMGIRHMLLLDMHHIVSDGVSLGILVHEFMRVLDRDELPRLPLQYKDYSQWQEANRHGEAYWLRQLAGDLPVLSLPLDFPRPTVQSFEGTASHFELDAPLTAALKQAALESGVTLYMILFAAFNVLLARLGGQLEIVVGSPVACRRHPSLQRIIGMFINMLVMRTRVPEDQTFSHYLQQVREVTLEAYENQEYPFEDLVEQVAQTRDVGRNPLFDVMFSLQNMDVQELQEARELEIPGLTITPRPIENTISKFDISFIGTQRGDRICFSVEYCTRLFQPQTIGRFIGYYKNIVAALCPVLDREIGAIELMGAEEKRQILHGFNASPLPHAGPRTIPALFERQVERFPDRLAVVGESSGPGGAPVCLTFKDLRQRSIQLAAGLRQQEQGGGCGRVAAIMMPRCPGMIIAIMAVLETGSAYLPIDPGYPQERIAYMLADSGAGIVLDGQSVQALTMTAPPSQPSQLLSPPDPAYIIYTSGSTGQPKGVMVAHGNVANLVLGLNQMVYRRYRGNLNVAMVAPYVFDASVQQIFGVLLLGHTLMMVPEAVRIDGRQLARYYRHHGIDVSDGTPVTLRLLLEGGGDLLPQLCISHFIIGGEALPRALVDDFLSRFPEPAPTITNVYGPTECCVDSTYFEIDRQSLKVPGDIPIGRPMPNEQVYILDQKARLQPVGLTGELTIAGEGVGRGYLNNPELTADRFMNIAAKARQDTRSFSNYPLYPKSQILYRTSTRSLTVPKNLTLNTQNLTLYRTGDQARWRPDGNIEFLGRLDHQVKIRGYRIELGEIENRLIRYRREDGDHLGADPPAVHHCTRCLLPANYPGIEFDEQGVCRLCRDFESYRHHARQYFKTPADFRRLAAEAKAGNRSDYDCLLLFSGGKDSSYVLYRLLEMGLKVLAFTFDNGYISGTAFENIERMTAQPGVTGKVCRAAAMKEVFLESLHRDYTVCTGCFKALTTLSTRLAIEEGINLVVTGLSRGQILDTKLAGLYSQGIFAEQEIEEKLKVFRSVYHSGSDPLAQLLDTRIDPALLERIHFVDFFRYDDASAADIKAYLRKRDPYWQRPGDTGFCSTNCLINDVGIYVHTRKTGYHNYAAPLSWDCRLGRCPKEEAAGELRFEVDTLRVKRILQELGYFRPLIKDACVVVRQDKRGEPYLCAYIVASRELAVPDLRAYLAQQLPGYMVPSRFVPLKQLPLTTSGKVDRRRLPEPDMGVQDRYAAPQSDREKMVADTWKEVLKLERVGIHDNFFELGGNSLDFIKIAARLKEIFGQDVQVVNLFRFPTIHHLCRYLSEGEDEEPLSRQDIQRAGERMQKTLQRMRPGKSANG